MRNLQTIRLALAVCVLATSIAGAATKPVPLPPTPWLKGAKPYATVTLPKTPISFSEAPNSDGKRLTAKLTATVYANHPYKLCFTFAGLTQGKDAAAIPPEQLSVKVNGKNVPVGTTPVEFATGPATTPKGVNVAITIEVELKDVVVCRAGHYGGNMAISIK